MNRAIDEAVRVTKPGGVIMFAFISVYAIMYANYLYGRWAFGQQENFTEDYKVKHFKEQLFTGYDVIEFEELFRDKPVDWITTAGTDGLLEPVEERPDFRIKDEDFDAFCDWYLAIAEKRELLGNTNHLLYICRKRQAVAASRSEESLPGWVDDLIKEFPPEKKWTIQGLASQGWTEQMLRRWMEKMKGSNG